jgi:nucleotide-binding universal stress UspA family protein
MTIVAAVDGEQIPDTVVEVGADLASQYGEQLTVVHVMPQETYESRADSESSSGVGYLTGSGSDYGDESAASYSIDQARRDAAGVARDVTEESLEELPDTVTYEGRVGETVNEVLGVVDEHDPQFLVIGGRKRTPVGKAVFGSATQSFLLNATVPVVTVMTEE